MRDSRTGATIADYGRFKRLSPTTIVFFNKNTISFACSVRRYKSFDTDFKIFGKKNIQHKDKKKTVALSSTLRGIS